jgi:hypothetical protein
LSIFYIYTSLYSTSLNSSHLIGWLRSRDMELKFQYFHSVKSHLSHQWKIPSFTSWKYFYHCTSSKNIKTQLSNSGARQSIQFCAAHNIFLHNIHGFCFVSWCSFTLSRVSIFSEAYVHWLYIAPLYCNYTHYFTFTHHWH